MKKTTPWIGLLFLPFLLGSSPDHAVYISLTEIRYEPGSGELRLGVRMFSDDLEDALRNQHGRSVPVRGHWGDPAVQGKIEGYVLQKVRLRPAPDDWSLLALRQQNDATWIELKGKVSPNIKRWEVSNALLTEVFDTQSNVVKFYWREQMQALRLNREETQATLGW